MISSSFSFFRRSSKSLPSRSNTPLDPCICTHSNNTNQSLDLTSPLEPTTSHDSHLSISSSSPLERSNSVSSSTYKDGYFYEPPCPKGGSEGPILLPNEVLLQKFSNRKSGLRLSKWKVQQQRLKCKRCSMVGNCSTGENSPNSTTSTPSTTTTTTTSTSTTTTSSTLNVTENCHDELSADTVSGAVYVTSERLIFVPKSESLDGYTLDITSLTSMKAIESTKRIWFFVCYKDNNSIATIPFSTKNRCQAFLRLIKNIRFEHMVRQCLPPRYTPPLYEVYNEGESNYTTTTPSTDTPDEWWYGDNQLPSYSESEEALHKYLITLGLLTDSEPLDRTERISRLIALATVPQSVSLDHPTECAASTQDSTPRSMPTATPIPEAYHSPYVWF